MSSNAPVDAAGPVVLTGDLDPAVSRGLWLVKWLLVIPHAFVLFFLWAAVVVLTVVAWFAILVTGRYPRSVFEFNVGVLRWSWRVFFYAYGALGTDRYPPFTLADRPDYPARLQVAYPERLSRGLVLVKSWLLALPHYLVLGFFLGAGYASTEGRPGWPWTVGLVGLLVVIAGVVLLVTGRYPRPVFDLVLGMDRWAARVAAYTLLMTDHYPPFRLDQGGQDGPHPPPLPGAPAGPGRAEVVGDKPAQHWTALRTLGVALGCVALAAGLVLGLAGGALMVVDKQLRDDDGFVMTGGERFGSSGYAVVSDDVRLRGGAIHAVVGDIKLTVRGSDQPVLLGIAPTSAARRYLAAVEHSVLTEVRSGTPLYREVAGGPPAEPPTAQTFWWEQVTGSGDQTLRWDASEGRWTVVLMNADGSAPVSAEVAAGATLPVLGWGSVSLLVTAVLILGVGLALVLVSLPRHGSQTGSAPPAPAPTGLTGTVR